MDESEPREREERRLALRVAWSGKGVQKEVSLVGGRLLRVIVELLPGVLRGVATRAEAVPRRRRRGVVKRILVVGEERRWV